ncbi:MAG TPA: DUF3500 domain-containing protein [Pirellulaceae bacterium]|jgi:hypothetical protein|nr:DUF3500 domain-containing protein [Pirellulaceae bacterium]
MPAGSILSRYRFFAHAAIAVSAIALGGWKVASVDDPGAKMQASAQALLDSLDEDQTKIAHYAFDSSERTTWAFVPLDTRKGLQLRDMNDEQKKLAFDLLEASVSNAGHTKAVQIMKLETLLKQMQKGDTPIRDPLRYYFAVYGDPEKDAKWGLSIEGHHLSLNFVVEEGKLSATTPTFYAANPAVIPDDLPASVESPLPPNTRVLGPEELLAVELRKSFSEEQAKAASLQGEFLKELRGPNETQPPQEAPAGIAFDKLNEKQAATLKQLIEVYARNVPEAAAKARLAAIEKAGWNKVRLVWSGSTEQGEPRYYRVQGPTFLIEFVNSQPDAAGNPANHIHSVWRDMHGDFGLPIAAK